MQGGWLWEPKQRPERDMSSASWWAEGGFLAGAEGRCERRWLGGSPWGLIVIRSRISDRGLIGKSQDRDLEDVVLAPRALGGNLTAGEIKDGTARPVGFVVLLP